MLQKLNDMSGRIIILVLLIGFVYVSGPPHIEGLLIAILTIITLRGHNG